MWTLLLLQQAYVTEWQWQHPTCAISRQSNEPSVPGWWHEGASTRDAKAFYRPRTSQLTVTSQCGITEWKRRVLPAVIGQWCRMLTLFGETKRG